MSTNDEAAQGFRSYIEQILERAEAEPDAGVVRDRERELTAREFAELVYRLSRALESAGLGQGDRVAILATISPEALAIRYAAGLLGCATVFCPNKGSDKRFHSFLAHVRADALVVFPETARAAAATIASSLVPSAMSLGAVPGIDLDLLALAGSMSSDPLTSRARARDLGALVSSGGTTGGSKASRRSFAAYGRMVEIGPTPDRRLLVCTALAYVAQVLVDQVMVGGGVVVFRDRFDPAEVLRTIEADGITHLGLVEPTGRARPDEHEQRQAVAKSRIAAGLTDRQLRRRQCPGGERQRPERLKSSQVIRIPPPRPARTASIRGGGPAARTARLG
jgi:fatty-acyl-CoA synthase